MREDLLFFTRAIKHGGANFPLARSFRGVIFQGIPVCKWEKEAKRRMLNRSLKKSLEIDGEDGEELKIGLISLLRRASLNPLAERDPHILLLLLVVNLGEVALSSG